MSTVNDTDNDTPVALNVKKWDTVPVKINKLHCLAQEAAATAIEYAVAAGELLIEEKKSVGHGGWLSWIQDNVDFSERTARNYMRVAQALPKLEDEERQRVADLSFRDVLSTLAKGSNRLRLPAAAIAERFLPQQREPIKKRNPPADTSPARTFKMPVWRIELRDRVLKIVQETMTQHPKLKVVDVVEALNDAYCELQFADAWEFPKDAQ